MTKELNNINTPTKSGYYWAILTQNYANYLGHGVMPVQLDIGNKRHSVSYIYIIGSEIGYRLDIIDKWFGPIIPPQVKGDINNG